MGTLKELHDRYTLEANAYAKLPKKPWFARPSYRDKKGRLIIPNREGLHWEI